MFKKIKYPVKRILNFLKQLENNTPTPKDLFLIKEIKDIATKISKGIGTKKTLNNFLGVISQATPSLSPELNTG